MDVPPTARDAPRFVRIDGRRLARVLGDFVAGTGVLIVYLALVVASLAGAGFAVLHLRGWMAGSDELVTGAAVAAALLVWIAAWRGSIHLLGESGVELGPPARVLALVAAPAAFALVVTVHLLGAMAQETGRFLLGLGYLLGAAALLGALALLYLRLR